MNVSNLWHTVELGFKNLFLHKLRSFLTILGIIFGVCSVITMLAVGEGASQESQERIKHLGRDNIIIESVKPTEDDSGTDQQQRVLKYGITHLDLERIKDTVKGVKEVIPQRILSEPVSFAGESKSSQIIGTTGSYKDAVSMKILRGRFLCDLDELEQRNVCVISRKLAELLFTYRDPLEHSVKIRGVYYQVVGVVSEGGEDDEKSAEFNAYLPLSTIVARYGLLYVKQVSGAFTAEQVELHKAVVRMESADTVVTGEAQIRHILEYSHKKEEDYKMVVPLQLLKEAEETKRMFNIVLGSIAAISLVVGGIGVMNIMLATVTERTREIGLRRALGAKKKDIVSQFMVESVLLSLCGGLVGVVLGIFFPYIISASTDMSVVVTPVSVIVAFGVSALIGLVFGIYPAAKSAQLDPIEALRNE